MGLFNYTAADRVADQTIQKPRYRILSRDRVFRMLSAASLVLIWQIIAGLRLLELPTPLETLRVFVDLVIKGDPLYNKTLLQIVWASLLIVIKACVLSFIAAVPMGILMGSVEKLKSYFDSIIEMIRPIPPLAWIPLAYVIFANTGSPTEYVQIFTVFIGAFFPVLLNTIHGISMVNRIHIEAARTMGSSSRQVLIRVMLPGALPAIFSGIRVGFGVGWMCIVAAEFVGGKLGIGYYIWSSYSVGGRTAEIISGMVAIGIVGSLINWIILFLEKRLIPWR
ncbi:ABC transporter permease [Phosphitispora fastidiosa]|uniref:ABC transporter permease n=1 Tax=Phosphitispora fastidiosa TaxID=2837202 RepID=UPI001E35AD66|nr:ABC transporter permease [Phosphitispora fastidiosa]MBU7007998.1 NitT/TauT family transport system permease protein [Phosphitispora fastidiosa]